MAIDGSLLLSLCDAALGLSGSWQTYRPMDFQLARNLSALARAQEETRKALLHIDSLADCLDREIIMTAASSEATEQLVTAAKTSLYQLQAILATQFEDGASRLRDAQISFITNRRERFSSTSASHVSQSNSQGSLTHQSGAQSATTARDTASDGHSYAQTAIRGNLWRHDED